MNANSNELHIFQSGKQLLRVKNCSSVLASYTEYDDG